MKAHFRSGFLAFAGWAVRLGIAVCMSAPAAWAQSDPGTSSLLKQYDDWSAYTGLSGGRKVCFAIAQPVSSRTVPPNRPRDPIYMFVSTRPAEKVRNEVSVMIGYTFRPSSEAIVEIGSEQFVLQTQQDNAWLKNPAEDGRMLEAMRRGSELTVKGVSGRGTQTNDRFSLKGLAQALDRVAQECR